jgi:dipeptidyl aminopeptidase/acylaminoacyl peptidase
MKKTSKVIFSLVVFCIVIFLLAIYFVKTNSNSKSSEAQLTQTPQNKYATFPLSIEYQRNQSYPGSDFKIEQTLADGSNYHQYIASYKSEGLKIYGLLSIPSTTMPVGGYPAIIFNHGYIPPEEYRTTERYVAYFEDLASEGYIVFKPDYRGNGSSEGKPEGAYFSPAYITDVLNALSSVEKMKEVNKEKIGMWGHSLGGFLTFRALVISNDIKAAVIWGGVVGSYKDMSEDWWSKRTVPSFTPSQRELQANRPSRQSFIKKYGEPSDNEFWNAISATTYIDDITTPIQLHHGLADETVPPILSQKLYDLLKSKNKVVELYTYEGSDHNISQGFTLAMDRTIAFFAKYLK